MGESGQSPYAPPQAELVGSDALVDGRVWTYPLQFSGTLGFYPRHELRDARQRLLWLAELGPINRAIPFQARRGEAPLLLTAKLESIWSQRCVFRETETQEELASLTRIGGCLPGAFVWPAWVGLDSTSGARVVLRGCGPPLVRRFTRLEDTQPPLARTGLQDPDAFGLKSSVAQARGSLATVHASEQSPPFLRVRRVKGAFRRCFVIERLEEGAEERAALLAFLRSI